MSRSRTESIMPAILVGQHIPFAAARAQQLDLVTGVDFLSRTQYIHSAHVRKNIIVLVPGVLGQVFASEHLALAAGQAFENRILLGGQLNGPAGAGNGAALQLDAKIADLDDVVVSGGATA